MSLPVVRNIICHIKGAKYYSLIADETTDCQGKQQLCVAFRCVDDKIKAHEDFVGLYEVADTSAKAIGDLLLDAVIRCNLDISNMRGQGYDGCNVIAGKHTGVSSCIRDKKPRALFVHCLANSMN